MEQENNEEILIGKEEFCYNLIGIGLNASFIVSNEGISIETEDDLFVIHSENDFQKISIDSYMLMNEEKDNKFILNAEQMGIIKHLFIKHCLTNN